MNINKYIILALLGGLSLTSCKEKGCMDPLAANYDPDAEKDDGSCEYCTTCDEPELVVPATYAFTDANGNSTVNFNGQQQRLEMLSEMSAYMKTAHTSGTAVDATTLKDMYANNGFTWADAPQYGMNGSSKQLKNKTAASSGVADPTIQAEIEALMDAIATLSATTTAGNDNGAPGVGGVVVSTTDNSKKYLQSAEGMEYVQLIEKGLMGAVFYNQMTAYYLSDGKMNVDNTTAVDPDNGKYYTQMEHHWDEAYGYFTSEVDFPTNGTDRFWGKYANSRESVLESATKISTAFRTGRAAIAIADYDVRDAQIAIIRTEMEKMCGGTAIHYLNGAIDDFADDALRNHQLSEAVAFIESLKYGANPSVTTAQINDMLNTIGTDFYNVTLVNLNTVRDQLAGYLGLTNVKDVL